MRKKLTIILSVIIVSLLIILALSGFIIDYQWFSEVNYLNVFLKSYKVKIAILIPSFILIYFLIILYIKQFRKKYLLSSNRVIDKITEKRQNKMISIISIIMSAIISISFTNVFWYKILEFKNSTDFGVKDPIFNHDVSFYVFKMPLIESITYALMTIVIFLIIITLAIYFMMKEKDNMISIKSFIKGEESEETKFFAKQLSVLGAIFLLLLSLIFYIKKINLVYSPRGAAFGASYTDVHVTLYMYTIISLFCIAASFVVAFSIMKKKIKPIITTGAFIIILIIAEGIVSGVVEKFIVEPNAKEKEMPYLTYNINLTRKAFGLDNIETRDFKASYGLTQEDINKNKSTVDNIRINEFDQSLEVFNQIQSIRNYYKFYDVDIDRYNIDGNMRQVFTSARELDVANRDVQSQDWQNKHLFYTHGYGTVMSYTNKVGPTGLPEFIIKDIPAPKEGSFKIDKPQIYFGELNENYVIVGAKNNEIDFPYGNGNSENRYDGTAGIKLTPFNRLLFAVNKGSFNFILSNNITSQSKVILNRNIVNRINKIAPFINYDKDPYIVQSNGKLYWIIDGYTTTDRYPFSEPCDGVNYIRNSIKVVVDAYNGNVDFYLTDKNDAIANTIGKIYKGIFKDIKDMPEDLRNHLRYSEDVFRVQSKVYEKYHVEDPSVFYYGEDAWSIAKYKDKDGKDVEVQPVYQVMKLPSENQAEFLLTLPFTVAKKENMVSWLAIRMGSDGVPDMVLIKFPQQTSVYGPQQFNSKINTDTAIASQLTLLSQRGSEYILGETSIIPIENSIIFVRPLYLKSQSGKSLPELKKVIVGYGDKVVMEDDIQSAFKKLFNVKVEGKPETAETKPGDVNINELINKAADLFEKAKNAQMSGKWAEYGDYLKQLEDTLNLLKEKSK